MNLIPAPDPRKTCGTCAAFAILTAAAKDRRAEGECRLEHPKAISGDTRFPAVDEACWCISGWLEREKPKPGK